MTPAPEPSSGTGVEAAAFITAQLAAEVERRKAVEDRANAALTAATTLVALIASVFALVHGGDFTVEGGARQALVVALLLMLGTAVVSLLAREAVNHLVPGARELRALTDSQWDHDETKIRRFAAANNINTLLSLRKGTNKKHCLLRVAGLLQLFSVLALIVCVWLAT